MDTPQQRADAENLHLNVNHLRRTQPANFPPGLNVLEREDPTTSLEESVLEWLANNQYNDE